MAGYSVFLSSQAAKYLERCGAVTRDRIKDKLEKLKANPFDPPNSKPLKGRKEQRSAGSEISEFCSASRQTRSSSPPSNRAAKFTNTACEVLSGIAREGRAGERGRNRTFNLVIKSHVFPQYLSHKFSMLQLDGGTCMAHVRFR